MNDKALGEAMESLHGFNPFKEDAVKQEANLGLASTKQLIDELAARAEVAIVNSEKWPRYRTVDGHPEPTRDDDDDRGEFGMPTLGSTAGVMAEKFMSDVKSAFNEHDKRHSAEMAIVIPARPHTGQAWRIVRDLMPQVMVHFITRNKEYGESSNVLGKRGQYADINRKVIKLKRYLWDDVPVPDAGESIETIATELIGHLLILIDELLMEKADGEGETRV